MKYDIKIELKGEADSYKQLEGIGIILDELTTIKINECKIIIEREEEEENE